MSPQEAHAIAEKLLADVTAAHKRSLKAGGLSPSVLEWIRKIAAILLFILESLVKKGD